METMMDGMENEIAIKMIGTPDFWWRAKLFISLVNAQKAGVLEEVLDEIDDLDQSSIDRIVEHLNTYWNKWCLSTKNVGSNL